MAESFRVHAEAYVAAIERGSPLASVRQSLANLYAAGLALDAMQDSTGWDDPPCISHEDWREAYDAIARNLSTQLYQVIISDPFQVAEEAKLAVGDLADDLADVWRDMTEGLLALDKGIPESAALWHWKLMFDSHWGVHAVRALGVMHKSAS